MRSLNSSMLFSVGTILLPLILPEIPFCLATQISILVDGYIYTLACHEEKFNMYVCGIGRKSFVSKYMLFGTNIVKT